MGAQACEEWQLTITLPRSICLFSILTERVVKSYFERCFLLRLAIGAREQLGGHAKIQAAEQWKFCCSFWPLS
jgi:hypothetical protein